MAFEAPVHKRNFDAVSTAPTRYIILTQGHVDHVGGVDYFREPGTDVVAQANNRYQQADDARLREFRAARSGFAFADSVLAGIETTARELGPPPPQAVPVPTITFDDRCDLELGELRLELLATPGGETTDSLVIWLPQHRICFAGNLFSALFGHFPNLVTIRGDRYRDALRFIESLDRVLALEPDLLLVGHHDPVRGRDLIRDELLRLRGAVQYVHDATLAGMNAGKDVYTLMREIRLPPELEVGQGYGKVSWSVRAIWETYSGWFHHHSTTELYDVPAWGVHGDLVELAGGAEVVAERARAKLDAGAPLEAIYLAEIALAADADHRVALEVALDAHERLEKESENFWLTSWLRRQCKTLRERLDRAREEIRITDLAEPVLNDVQRSALQMAEKLNVDFSAEHILGQARTRSGLSDFGPEDFRERLRLLAEEWGGDEGLTNLGRLGLQQNLIRYATNRLLIQDELKRHAKLREIPIDQPIIVAGLPRTGTTHLLNLMAADSRLRALPLWESYEPLPLPNESLLADGTDPRYRRCADAWASMQLMTPLLAAMHPMNPDHIHEELELMTPDFASYNFEWLSMSPCWRDHYYRTDQTPHYRYMKDVLRILQKRRGPSRWVLKCPQHLEQLPVLQEVFPDATVVFTHRDPVAVVQSALTMLAYGQRVSRKRVEIAALAEYWVARIEHLLVACVRDRGCIPPERSLDVRFDDFMADELGTVARVHAKAGLEMSPAARAELQAFARSNPRGKAGRVVYDLNTDFGIDPAMLRKRFSFYYERFGVRAAG
jgi:glyoxylase-like metal-dependent hydrolase (beta-lactamase superfamily II)